MNIVERWNMICDLIAGKDYMTVDELVEKTGASPATIRRDIKSLEEEGRLARFRGGVKPVQQTYVGAFTLDKRLAESQAQKQAICRKAASLVQDGDYIYIDTSSTTHYLVDYISSRDISVVTNSATLLPKLLRLKIKTYIFGGNLQFESGAIIGEEIKDQIRSMNFDKVFLGSYGVDLDAGFTTYDTAEGQLKHQLLSQCRNAYILADSRKFGIKAFYTYGALDAATLITDEVPPEYRNLNNVICV